MRVRVRSYLGGFVMARGDPVRVRAAVHDRGAHVGSVTTVGYPDRDLTAFPEGQPWSEVVVSDLAGAHVALFQRFRQHWLVHCGPAYDTADAAGPLDAARTLELAVLALRLRADPPAARSAELAAHLEAVLRAG
jgi:hypothetical protein